MTTPKYSVNVINKSLTLELDKVRENEDIILYHVKATHSDKYIYKISYNKHRDEINCECQMFQYTRKCSHSLKALKIIKGDKWFWENIKIIEYS